MGLYLSLNLASSIASDQWDRFWCDSLRLLQDFPLRLVRQSKHKLPYGFLKTWTNMLVATDKNGEYWEIAGDAESLAFGEPVRLYRNIEYYQQKNNKSKAKNRPKNEDPLFCTSQDYTKTKSDVPLAGMQLFQSKTQGYPYHHAIVAVLALAEHRFPLYSFAWGDLRPKGCEAVRQWLSSRYNENMLPPICLDAARLWNRIEGTCGSISTTIKRFEERFLGSYAQQIHRMLAESKETTMKKLAEDLLRYDSVTLGFSELSKSFLEATDNLEMYLDLIDLRNSLTQSKGTGKKKCSVIKLEEILKMLIKGFVTYSQWQGEEIRTLRRWVELEGNVAHTINTTLLKAMIPDFFDYYCSESDLLATFIRREPAKRDLFNRVLQESLDDNLTAVDLITDFVRTMEECAERKESSVSKTEDYETENDDPESQFIRFMKTEASVQADLEIPLTENNVALLGRYFGYYAGQMQKIASNMDGMECKDFLNDSTGNNQKAALLGVIHQCEVRLLEEAIVAIEHTNDVELLKLFTTVSPCLFNEGFRNVAPLVFGKAFDRAYPALWHLINKPTWWKVFSEHRNDGKAGDELEI